MIVQTQFTSPVSCLGFSLCNECTSVHKINSRLQPTPSSSTLVESPWSDSCSELVVSHEPPTDAAKLSLECEWFPRYTIVCGVENTRGRECVLSTSSGPRGEEGIHEKCESQAKLELSITLPRSVFIYLYYVCCYILKHLLVFCCKLIPVSKT